MFCTRCKYTSFDYLPSCPRCGRDWTEAKRTLNLEWVVASAPERRHQRQVPENEAGLPPTASRSGSDQGPGEPFGAGHEARSSSPQPHLDAQSGSHVHENNGGEDELDFPDLDSLLHPQAASQSPEQSPAEAYGPADMQSPQKPEPRGLANEEPENDDVLDLSSLVHDLGLEADESGSSENKPQSSPSGAAKKSSTSSQG